MCQIEEQNPNENQKVILLSQKFEQKLFLNTYKCLKLNKFIYFRFQHM